MNLILRKNNRRKIKFIAMFIAILILVLALYQYRSAVYAKLNDLKLLPAEEYFTELYFGDLINLPKTVPVDGVIKFSFVIHNVEGENLNYHYRVYMKNSFNQTANIKDSVVQVNGGETKIIGVTYSLISWNYTDEVVYVELLDFKQNIHFALSK